LAAIALPNISYVPGQQLTDSADQLHVFRIDVTEKSSYLGIPAGAEYRFGEVSLDENAYCGSQLKASIDYSWAYQSFANAWCGIPKGETVSHSLIVRIYRRGYDTVEIGSWKKDPPIEWVPVIDVREQEKAIDDLLSTIERKGGSDKRESEMARGPFHDEREQFGHLVNGSMSETHQKAMLFAAREYEWLAKSMQTSDIGNAVHNRLLAKADYLRKKMPIKE
jgi:hypothetical protein